MAFRSLAVSLFIIFLSFGFTINAPLNREWGTNSFGEYQPYRQPTEEDSGLGTNVSSVEGLDLLDNPAQEEEQLGGADFGPTKAGTVLKNVFLNSTIGFADFWRNTLGFTQDSLPGMLLELAMWGIMLNHAFVLMQLLVSFGGKL